LTITVADNLPPVAIATADKTEGPAPLTVQFDGSQSYDPEGKPLLEYYWDFGDGSMGSYAVTPPPYTYTFPGTYAVVILGVTDERGAVGTDTIVITVTEPVNHPPVASPTVVPNTGSAPLTVQFTANASDPDGDAITYLWNFDDGTTGTVAAPSHVFKQPGTYLASLTVTDSKGAAKTYSPLTIAVSSPITLSVDSASIKLEKKNVGSIDVDADFADLRGTLPMPGDVIGIWVDGIEVLSVPFGEFKPEGKAADHKFKYDEKGLVVKLDYGKGTLSAHTPKIPLVGLDEANGVDVELMIGDYMAVENIAMKIKKGKLEYRR
jgi:PKD repeat protein